MRRLLVLLAVSAVLVVVLLVVDRRVETMTEERVAEQIQLTENLAERPQVDMIDNLFLLAALRGRYNQMIVSSPTLTAPGAMPVRDAKATMDGVSIPFREVLDDAIPAIRAERLQVEATIDYPSLSSVVAAQADGLSRQVGVRIKDLAITGGPDGVLRITGTYEAAGLSVRLVIPVRVSVEGQDLVLGLAPSDTTDPLASVASQLITGRFRIPPLPYGLTVQQVRPGPDGLLLVAAGQDVLIER